MLASLYYMSNYATKDDVKLHQLVMTAAILKASLDKAVAVEGDLTAEQRRLLDMRPSDYAMKIYNQFRKEREIGAVMISSYLIGNPAFYMPNEKYRNLDLLSVKRAVRGYATQSRPLEQARTTESVVEEGDIYAKFHTVEKPTSFYIDYVHRGPRASHLCLYEYMSQIGSIDLKNAPSDSFPFEPEHPKSSTHRQYSVRLRERHGEDERDGLWIPAIYGTLTDVNNKGKTPGQILDDSQNVKNDIAEAMLGLLVPWERLQDLFEIYASDVDKFPEPRDACALIWSKVRPELPLYLQRLAENFTYLRRSKEEADKDRKARGIEIADWEERALDYPEDPQFVDQLEEDENLMPEFLSRQDFQHGFMDTLNVWNKRGAGIGQLEPDSLRAAESPSIEFSARALLPVKLSDILLASNIGIKHSIDEVHDWEQLFRNAVKKVGVPLPQDDDDFELAFDGSEALTRNLHSSTDSLQSTPTLRQHLVSNENIDDLRHLYQLNPCLQNLMGLVGKKYQLNDLQLLTVSVLLTRVCGVDKRRGHGFAKNLSEQFLTYVGGAAGTGKTLLVMAFLRGLDILGRLDEVLLTAPTGSAAAHSEEKLKETDDSSGALLSTLLWA